MMSKGQNFIGKKPINTPKGPSTQAQVDLRITEVGKLLIQGYSRFEIVSLLHEKYSISPQQVDKYIKTAKERIREKNSEDLKDSVALINAQIDDCYKGAREKGDWNGVARALKLKIDFNGLATPPKKQSAGGLSISEEMLKRDGGYLGLSEEEMQLARDMTGLSERIS